jgi:hypothetical protein
MMRAGESGRDLAASDRTNCVQVPLASDVLQLVLTAFAEFNSRPGYEIFDGA